MGKLLAFLRRFRIFLFFTGLQIGALYFYFSSLSFPKSQYNSIAVAISASVWRWENDLTKFIHLDETNSKLLQQNKLLRERLPESFIQLENGLVKIEDTLHLQQYEYIPSTVINSTFDKRNNYLTINIGSTQGITPGMGVFADQGIVGVVHRVSKHFSLVRSVLSQNINLDAMVQKNGAFGLLKWETKNDKTVNISGVSNDIPIRKGQRVITRGGGGIFPRGLPIGKVHKVAPIEGKPLWYVEVKLGVNFRAVQKVYVIKNLLKNEQETLESLIPIEKEDD